MFRTGFPATGVLAPRDSGARVSIMDDSLELNRCMLDSSATEPTAESGGIDPAADNRESAGAAPSGGVVGMQDPVGELYSLDPRSIRVDQWVGLMVVGGLSLGSWVGILVAAIVKLGFSPLWWAIAGAAIVIQGGLFWSAWAWPPVEHRHARWRWDRDGLEIHRGVFFKHRISIPSSRIQHVDVSQGPLQRQFGLGKITIHTAGTQDASIELSGLAYETALWLREQMVARQGAADAV